MTLPAHLSSSRAQGLRHHETVAQWEIGTASNFVYGILDRESREAALVDTHKGILDVASELTGGGFRLASLLLTHTHWDHIGGLEDLIRAFPGLQVVVHAEDLHRLKSDLKRHPGLKLIHDRELIRVGRLEVEALHTPGHSAGEVCYFLRRPAPGYLFTGDTVFIRDCGRTDLETGSTAQLFESLQKLKKLPPETVILPGHHYAPECASTLAAELRDSPPFLCQSVVELENLP